MTIIALYIKTHRKTGLKYLGITTQDPWIYKGSGTRWTNHINKYGYDVSTEVIIWCKDKGSAKWWGIYYSDLWNVVNDDGWANLKREEGDGGFEHINSLPSDDRVNVKAYRKKVASGEITVGGTTNWTDESWEKVRMTSWGNRTDIPSPWDRPAEDIKKTKDKMSKSATGEGNSQYGTHVYIDPVSLTKRRYKKDDQPVGWITVEEWNEGKKDKTNSAYGRHWYNDGVRNYYTYPNDPIIESMSLEKRRLRTWKESVASSDNLMKET